MTRSRGGQLGSHRLTGQCRSVSIDEALDWQAAVADRVRAARIARNVPARALADAIDAKINTVFSWERGRRIPSLATVYQIARALDVPIAELLGGPP